MVFTVGFPELINGNGKLLPEKLSIVPSKQVEKNSSGQNIKGIVLQRRTAHAKSVLRAFSRQAALVTLLEGFLIACDSSRIT